MPFAPLFPSDTPPALAGAALGGSLGLLQWLVLRGRVAQAALWIAASVCAWLVPFVINGPVISNATGAFSIILLPPIITSLGWWLSLHLLSGRASRGGKTPSGAPTALARH